MYKLIICSFVFVLSTITLLSNYSNEVEGQLAIPNITQLEENPESVEQMAMQALFSLSGKLYGFGLNVNHGSLLCPSNSCEFTFKEGTLRQDSVEEYVLEGRLNVAEYGSDNLTAKIYPIESKLNVKETQEQGSNITKFITGFFDIHSDTKFNYEHYYIYNGTLSLHPDGMTMILQGKVLPKRS